MEIPLPANIGKEVAFGVATIGAATLLIFGGADIGERMHNDAISSWSSAMRERLDPNNLLPGSRYYKSVKVVGAGRTLGEALDTKVINVREYPGFTIEVMPGLSLDSRVIGDVSVGTLVPDVVVLSNGWGVTGCDNIWKRNWETGSQKLCAVYADYLLAQKEDTKPAQDISK